MTSDDHRHHSHRLRRAAADGDRADVAAPAPGGRGGGRRADADLGGGAGDGRAARAADAERAGRDRAGEAADGDPDAARASARPVWSSAPPTPTTGAAPWSAITAAGRERLRRLRGRKNAYLARRMRELPAADVETLERAAEILEGMLEERRSG